MVSPLVALLTGLCPLAAGEAPDTPPGGPEAAFAENFGSMFKPVAGLNWDEEAPRLRVAAEQLWRRNGWTDESDVYARNLACEISDIPPWDVVGRLRLLTTRVSERYGLTAEQSQRLTGSLLRETGGFFLRNSRVLLEHGNEGLETRARGRPYTREQVQRWAKAAEPLLADFEAMADRLAKEIEPGLAPDKKEVFARDWSSFEKRTKYIDDMRVRWVEGKWTPADWGIEKDPIQNGELAQLPDPPSVEGLQAQQPQTVAIEPAAPPLPTNWLPHDPTTWIAYVMHVEKRFGLDAGQKSTSASIHAELTTRATHYIQTHRDELHAIARPDRAAHAAYEPVRTLFTELQERLDALPTTTQRAAAAGPAG
jgi:hypothetical protein